MQRFKKTAEKSLNKTKKNINGGFNDSGDNVLSLGKIILFNSNINKDNGYLCRAFI